MNVRTLIAAVAMATTGCAVQPISGQIGHSQLDKLTVNVGEPKFLGGVALGQPVPGTAGIRFAPYVSPGAFLAGAIAGGIASGSAQTGIAIQQAITSSATAPASAEKVEAPEMYAASIDGLSTSGPVLAHQLPRDGILVTPFITLHQLEDGQLSHSCMVSFSGYAAGERKWTLGTNHSSVMLPPSALHNLRGPAFQEASRACFRLVTEAFVEYAKGTYDGKFRGGRMTLKNGQTRSGTFVRDDARGVALQVLISAYPQGMIVTRLEDVELLRLDP